MSDRRQVNMVANGIYLNLHLTKLGDKVKFGKEKSNS